MSKLYKFRSFDDCFTNKIIINSSLYFSAIKSFNDPFDCRLSFKQEYTLLERADYFTQLVDKSTCNLTLEQYLKKYPDNQSFIDLRNTITKKLINKIGVLSLSTNPNNILMWSHYSSNHTGLAFQFTFKQSSKCFLRPLVVDYKDKYELLSYILDFKTEAPKLMLTKHSCWKYESEVRIIDLDFQGEKKFKKHELTSIIFGALAKDDDIDKMMDLCKQNGFEHVKFSKAILTPGKFSLDYREILNISADAKP